MLKLRYYSRLTKAFLSRFKLIFLVGVTAGFLVFIAIQFLIPHLLPHKNERIGVTGRYTTESLPEEVLGLISIGLTSVDTQGNAIPAISSSWESKEEGRVWEFKLKEGLKWHDGVSVTTDTVNYEFSDVTVEKIDENTIKFRLEDPFSPFPHAVSRPLFRKGLVGIGEWKVEEVSVAGGFVQFISLSDSQGNKKTFKFYPTSDRTKLAFKLGEIDKIVNAFDAEPFDSWNNVIVNEEEIQNQIVIIFFNTKDKFLGDKSFRQALSYAIDKSAIQSTSRALGPISPTSWAYNPQVKAYDYDSKRASEFIEDFPEELKDELSINLISTPALLSVAEIIEKQWEEIGVPTNVQVTSIVPDEYQAYLTILDVPPDPDQYSLWHSTQEGTNISKYVNQRIDKLLEDGRSALDTTERKRIYLDFQRFLLEDAPAVFLYHPKYYTIERK